MQPTYVRAADTDIRLTFERARQAQLVQRVAGDVPARPVPVKLGDLLDRSYDQGRVDGAKAEFMPALCAGLGIGLLLGGTLAWLGLCALIRVGAL